MGIRDEVFKGCFQHGRHDYYCHNCLADAVTRIVDKLEELEDNDNQSNLFERKD